MSRFWLLACLCLNGCVQTFDAGAYSKMVDAAATLVPTLCANPKVLDAGLSKFRSQIDWLSLYEGGMPSNDSTVTMLAGITDEADRFAANETNASQTYCQDKIAGIRHTMRALIAAEARKSKS